MRAQGNKDFAVEVEGIGRFFFGRRTMQDTFRIRGEYAALTSGNYDAEGNFGDLTALAFITLKTLMVSAPGDFTIDADPLLDDDAEERSFKVFMALREKEQSFRVAAKAAKSAIGASAGADVGGLVPEQVQPAADGPAVPDSHAG